MSGERVGERTGGETQRVDEVLPAWRMAVYGLQHVPATYAGAVAAPLILTNSLGLP